MHKTCLANLGNDEEQKFVKESIFSMDYISGRVANLKEARIITYNKQFAGLNIMAAGTE